MTGRGYALDLTSPVRHVATEMDKAGPSGPAPTVESMTATYQHTIGGDLARVRQHEGARNDYEARVWLIRKAIAELGKQVAADGDGWRLAKPLDDLKYQGRKVYRSVREVSADEKRSLGLIYDDLANEMAFSVPVEGARGSTKERKLTLHPLARALPRMSEKEFADLAADVKANGVQLPVVAIGDKVIDGRHRLAVAAALNAPLRVTEFNGDESAARAAIVSLNLIRRNLSMAQRVLIVRQVLLPEAQAEVSPGRPRTDTEKLAQDCANIPAGKKASQIAAERSAGLASARSIELGAPVDNAPQTQERVRSGEIKTVPEMRREALRETGSNEPADLPALKPYPAYTYLGQALSKIRNAAEVLASGERGDITDERLTGRIDEIGEALDDLRRLL